jgi:hypothetical protein
MQTKNVYWFLLIFVLCLIGLTKAAEPEEAPGVGDFLMPPREILTASGRLIEVKIEISPETITIQVPGGTSTAYLTETCVFFNEKGEEMSLSDFLGRYMDKIITVDFLEDNNGKNAIIECRAGRQ